MRILLVALVVVNANIMVLVLLVKRGLVVAVVVKSAFSTTELSCNI